MKNYNVKIIKDCFKEETINDGVLGEIITYKCTLGDRCNYIIKQNFHYNNARKHLQRMHKNCLETIYAKELNRCKIKREKSTLKNFIHQANNDIIEMKISTYKNRISKKFFIFIY